MQLKALLLFGSILSTVSAFVAPGVNENTDALVSLEERNNKPRQNLNDGSTWIHCNAFSVCEPINNQPTFCRKGYKQCLSNEACNKLNKNNNPVACSVLMQEVSVTATSLKTLLDSAAGTGVTVVCADSSGKNLVPCTNIKFKRQANKNGRMSVKVISLPIGANSFSTLAVSGVMSQIKLIF